MLFNSNYKLLIFNWVVQNLIYSTCSIWLHQRETKGNVHRLMVGKGEILRQNKFCFVTNWHESQYFYLKDRPPIIFWHQKLPLIHTHFGIQINHSFKGRRSVVYTCFERLEKLDCLNEYVPNLLCLELCRH